jgi:hypothetical protein
MFLLLFVSTVRDLIPPMSLPFLHSCNVSRSVSNYNGVAVELTSGPARVPTVDGWCNSRQTFPPVYLNGCDWIAFVNVRFKF